MDSRGDALKVVLSALGQPLPSHPLGELWFRGKVKPKGEWIENKKLGVAVRADGRQRVTSIFLYSQGVDSFSAYGGALPGELAWGQSRPQVKERLGAPEWSMEPTGGILGSPFAADRWPLGNGGKLHVE